MRSPLRARSPVWLRAPFRGTVTGRTVQVLVQYAWDGTDLLAVPGQPLGKLVLLDGQWTPGVGEVLAADHAGHDAALAAYWRR